jgi:hypothetical protein
MIKVKTKKILNALQSPPDNEIAIVEEDNKAYIYKDLKWQEYKPEDGGLKISLMELNSILVSQLPPLTDEQIEEAKALIKGYTDSEYGTYFMLLNNDLRYYTVFLTKTAFLDDLKVIEDEVIACLHDLGVIKSISINDDGVVECWVTIDDKSYPLFLFDYTKGVILCQ